MSEYCHCSSRNPPGSARYILSRTIPALLMVMLALGVIIVPASAAASVTVTGIIPATGINTTTVVITDLAGTNFLSGATGMLTPVNVHPVHKGSLQNGTGGALLNSPYGVFVSGNYAYVASAGSNALEIVDVSNPASPVHKGSIQNGAGGALLNSPFGVFVSGNYAYVASADSNALEIVDISNPASPVHKGSIQNSTGGALLNSPYGVFVSGNYAYVASAGSNALEIVDVSNPASPVHVGALHDGGGAAPFLDDPISVFVSGNYAYVASYDSSALEIVDVSNPAIPVHVGSLVDGGGSVPCLSLLSGIYVSGNYAYVASLGSDALEIVDVSNPASPVHVRSLDNAGGGAAPFLDDPISVFVSGNYAYVASQDSNALEIVNVTDAANPAHKGSIANGSGGALLNSPYSVFVSGNYAYVASHDSNALEIIDIGTITATSVNVVSPTKITGTFNLTGAVPGLYNVVVTNPDGSFGTLINGFSITTPPVAPVAAFMGIPLSGNAPLGVTFTDSSTGSSITSWRWDFGDGNITEYGVRTHPYHLYLSEGTYSINLTVTNSSGSNSQLRSNYITVTTHAPSPTPTPTPAPYDNSGTDSDPTPIPTQLRSTMITVNVGGDSGVFRANVTGTGHSELIITGTVASGPGQGISPAPGTVYEYIDLQPARYATIDMANISFTVPQSWLDEHNLAPQNIVLYRLTNITWTALPTTLVKTDNGRSYYLALSPGLSRFAISGDINSSSSQLGQSPAPKLQTFGDMVQATTAVSTVIRTPVALQTTPEPSAQPATQPSSGFSSMKIIGAGIVGVIILIGLALVVLRRKTDL